MGRVESPFWDDEQLERFIAILLYPAFEDSLNPLDRARVRSAMGHRRSAPDESLTHVDERDVDRVMMLNGYPIFTFRRELGP